MSSLVAGIDSGGSKPNRCGWVWCALAASLLLAVASEAKAQSGGLWQPYRQGDTAPLYADSQQVGDGYIVLDDYAPPAGPVFPGQTFGGTAGRQPGYWAWQVLPDGLIYQTYLASVHEPRLSAIIFHEENAGRLLDATFGARVGLLRYGSSDTDMPDGWQLDVEGVAFPRLNLDNNWDLVSTDFRAGIPLTYGAGAFRAKFGYYHLSSHMGDELILNVPGSGADRINYARDTLVLGISYYLTPALRLYGEAGWAFYNDGGSEPWEFQFGVDYSPIVQGICGAPFLAVNGHLREEVDFGGNVVAQAGWQWRGRSGHRFRVGAHYYNGSSSQYQFFRFHEEQIGAGLWYDF